MLKKFIIHSLVFSLVLNNLAFATNSIIELDFKDSQAPQRLHTILPSSKIADVSHIEIDTEKRQACVYRVDPPQLPEDGQDPSSVPPDVMKGHSVILQKGDVMNLPWELELEKLTLFILNHTAWLNSLDEDGYKLTFKGGLLGGGQGQSTGGGGGGNSGGGCRNESRVICDSQGNCTLEATLCMGSPSYNSNDHYISGTPHHGGNDRSGGYGSSTISSTGNGSRSGKIATLSQQNIVLNYPSSIPAYLTKNAFLPKGYVKDTLLDDTLLQIVIDYNKGVSSPMKIVLEPLAYIVRQDLRNMLNGLSSISDYTCPLNQSDVLKHLQILCDIHIDIASPDKWGVGPGSNCFHWGQIKKLNKNSAISKALAPKLFNKGVDLLKTSGQPIYKGSHYLLAQNIKGDLSSLCPYNGLVYPLFPDARANYQAFLPTTYVRNGYDTYLEQFFYKLAGEAFEGQEQSPMRYVFSPLPHVSRTAFKDIPMKKENFPSLKESSALLLGMAGDVMDEMPLEDLLNKAQKFFDKEIPFKKLNDDTLVHQHLSQNMLAKELREERWALKDQYWKTTSPLAQWSVVANAMEAVARKYNISGARLHGLIQVIEAVQEGGFEFVSQEKNERKIFLDHHVEEGFGRKVAEWLEYDAELMQVGKKLPFDIDPMAPHDMFNLQDKMGGFGGGKLGWNRLMGKNKLNPQKIERDLGTITESGFLKAAERYLGKDYVVHPKGRYVSKDGSRQIRYGRHETEELKDHHAHFEAYDFKTGKLNEWGRVKIIND